MRASTGNPVQNEETGLTEFRLTGPLRYLTWYHAVGLVWITEFILACQQMTVAGAVVTYYFTRCSLVGQGGPALPSEPGPIITFVFQGQEPTPGHPGAVFGSEAGPVPPGNGC